MVAAVVVLVVAVAGVAVVLTQGQGQSTSSTSSISSAASSSTLSQTKSSTSSSTASTSSSTTASGSTSQLTVEMALNPSTRVLVPGIPGNYTLTITEFGGSGQATFNVATTLPAGFSASATPQKVIVSASSPLNPQPTNVTIALTAANTVASGNFQVGFGLTGSGGSFNSTFPVVVSRTTVLMSNVEFLPGNLTVKAGTGVTWINLDGYGILPNDQGVHNVVLTSLNIVSPGLVQYQTWTLKFNQTGVYNYYCNFHTYMKGTITVTP